jgi:DNA-binding NtrC family response regulator
MNHHIMIVEDESPIRLFVRTILEKQGYTVSEAGDLAGLRAAFQGAAPAALILDLNLPDGNSLAHLGELKQKWPRTRVIILTGHGTVDAVEQAYQLEQDLFLHSKPVDGDTLLALVELALSRPAGASPAAQRES